MQIAAASGQMTLAQQLFISATANQLHLGGVTTTTINAVAPGSSVVYTLQDAGGPANIVLAPASFATNGSGCWGAIV